jgi:tRNA dimethylallyltransferase
VTATAPARVAVVGPTASGKSAVALTVAERLGRSGVAVELISIDSMQVYRGMDIGTAKPSADEQARVRHHLIDLVDPAEEFTVAQFQAAYRATLAALTVRDCRAILVGGTGLYHRAVIDELDLPGQWPHLRSRLEAEATELGVPALHARLAASDPAAAAKIEPSNLRRVVRALEVQEGSGRPFSSFGPGLDHYAASAVVQIGLRWDRAVLAARIEERVHRMLADGLLAEVDALLRRPGGLSRTAAQALGYRELIAHLEGRVGLAEATEQIVVRTRQFAVRQLRWFGRDPRVRWVDVEHDPVAEAAPAVLAGFDS